MKLNKDYWNSCYIDGRTGWDIGYASPPITNYIDQLDNKELKILIPGCGNAHEGVYLIENGFKNTFLIDISPKVIEDFKQRFPEFPKEQIICGDFFEHQAKYDLILEQTFFCALPPILREQYATKMSELLNPNGKLVGLLFTYELTEQGPPFGGSIAEYKSLFGKHFSKVTIEACYNSIKPRMGNEVFISIRK